jgi:hypothetical protein
MKDPNGAMYVLHYAIGLWNWLASLTEAERFMRRAMLEIVEA